MSTIELENTNVDQKIPNEGWSERARSFRCHVCVIPESEGGFSVVVLNLPGAGSCGETEDDALQNAREAIQGVIESHLNAGEDIPWKESQSSDIPDGAKHKWILVNV